MKAYLAGVPSLYEGEDVEIRYSIWDGEVETEKGTEWVPYCKPAVVGMVALVTLLNKLKDRRNEELVVLIHDGALKEIVSGTSTTKNKDVKRMDTTLRKALKEFEELTVFDVGADRAQLLRWNEVLHA